MQAQFDVYPLPATCFAELPSIVQSLVVRKVTTISDSEASNKDVEHVNLNLSQIDDAESFEYLTRQSNSSRGGRQHVIRINFKPCYISLTPTSNAEDRAVIRDLARMTNNSGRRKPKNS